MIQPGANLSMTPIVTITDMIQPDANLPMTPIVTITDMIQPDANPPMTPIVTITDMIQPGANPSMTPIVTTTDMIQPGVNPSMTSIIIPTDMIQPDANPPMTLIITTTDMTHHMFLYYLFLYQRTDDNEAHVALRLGCYQNQNVLDCEKYAGPTRLYGFIQSHPSQPRSSLAKWQINQRVKAPIRYQTQLYDPISCYGNSFERTT